MKKLLTFFVFSLLYTTITAQKASHEALIWRGFEHQWTYNHRINRLGSFVQYNQGQPLISHASASGMGADSTQFSNYYTQISSPHLLFQEGITEIELQGKEKDLLSKRFSVAVPAWEGMPAAENYSLLLNGFDIQASGGADKLKMLHLEAISVEYAPATQEFLLNFQVSLSVNCESLECSMLSQRAKYQFKLYYLIIAADYQNFNASNHNYQRAVSWTKKQELDHEQQRYQCLGKKDTSLNIATIGLSAFGLHLDQAHWTAAYHTHFQPLSYNPNTAKMDFYLDLYFKEWIFDMKRNSAYPPHSKFSKRKSGWAQQSAELCFLQCKDAKIEHGQQKGTMFWRARNAPPTAPEALQQFLIRPLLTN